MISNCIIYYSVTFLSELLAHREKRGAIQDLTLLKQVSYIAWQHINLHGRYEFSKRPEDIDLNAIIRQFTQLPTTQELAT